MWVGSRFHSLETFEFQFGNNFTSNELFSFKLLHTNEHYHIIPLMNPANFC